jgi:hypothetical protein
MGAISPAVHGAAWEAVMQRAKAFFVVCAGIFLLALPSPAPGSMIPLDSTIGGS